MSTLGERIKQAREHAGMSQEQLGSKVGVSRAAVSQWESNTFVPEGRQADIAKATGTRVEWLAYESGPMVELSPGGNPDVGRDVPIAGATSDLAQHIRPATPMSTGIRDVPIRGFARGGEEGFFLGQGELLGMAYRPAILESVADAFAVEVFDSSMHPALKHGHLAFIHPRKQAMPGDEVLVTFHDGQALLKELVRRTEKHVVLKQWNPPREFKIEASRINKIQLVVDSPRVRT